MFTVYAESRVCFDGASPESPQAQRVVSWVSFPGSTKLSPQRRLGRHNLEYTNYSPIPAGYWKLCVELEETTTFAAS